jgi:putative oxidoreductase
VTTAAAFGLLVLRLVLGVTLIMHGYVGYANIAPLGVSALVHRLGLPANATSPLAWYLLLAHTVGGALIVVGLWTRIAAAANVPIMMAAVAILQWPAGFSLKTGLAGAAGKVNVIGYEFSLLVLACTVAIGCIGPGPISLDKFGSPPREKR